MLMICIVQYESPTATPPPAVEAPDPPVVMPTARSSATTFNAATTDPNQVQAQEEYLRAMLRAQNAQPQQGQEQEDPMMKMLSQMMGGMSDDPNATGGLPFSPDDIAKATGLPSFVTNMMMGGSKAPPTPAQQRSTLTWKIIHVVFAIMAGTYLLFTITGAQSTYGASPPAPATFRNPFLVFVTGELLVQGSKIASSGTIASRGVEFWIQIFKDLSRDGAIVVFLMGLASWWNGMTLA